MGKNQQQINMLNSSSHFQLACPPHHDTNETTLISQLHCPDLITPTDAPQIHRTSAIMPRQSKDGANAARTARVTLVGILVRDRKKQMMEVLKLVKEDLQIQKLILKIGEKQFKNRFLFRKQFQALFTYAFETASCEQIEALMRKNKRSQLDLNRRISLIESSLDRYRAEFEQNLSLKKHPVLIPIALSPMEYEMYVLHRNANGVL